MFAVRADRAARDGAVEARDARRAVPLARHAAPGLVFEARVRVRERPRAGRVAAVERRVAAQATADDEVVRGDEGEQELERNDDHLQVERPAAVQVVGQRSSWQDARRRYRHRRQ